MDSDDDEGELDPLPDVDEDAVGREPRSAESSSPPTNTAVGFHKNPAGPLKLRSTMLKGSGNEGMREIVNGVTRLYEGRVLYLILHLLKYIQIQRTAFQEPVYHAPINGGLIQSA